MPRRKEVPVTRRRSTRVKARNPRLLARDVKQLRRWVEQKTDLEFTMHGTVCPASYSGQLTDVSLGPTAHFVFVADVGMRAHVVPELWTRSEISSVPGSPTTMTAAGSADQSGCHLSEVRKQGPSLHAKRAGDQLRLWAKMGVEVSVAIHQAFYELFFLAAHFNSLGRGIPSLSTHLPIERISLFAFLSSE
jgi:hypothetical protein